MTNKPGIASPIGGHSVGPDARESVPAEERRVSPGLSLQGIFGGHTSRGKEVRYRGKHHLCTREHTVANDAGWPEEIGELRLEAKHTIDMARFVDLDEESTAAISRSPITFFPMVTALMKAMSFCVTRR